MGKRWSYLEMLLQGRRVQVCSVSGSVLPNSIDVQRARTFVREGLAVIKGRNRIQLLWALGKFNEYIRQRDGFTCHYCGGPGFTVDHILPTSRGGRSTPANCVCACRTCNGLKANRTKEEFMAFVREMDCECLTDWMGERRRCLRHRIEEYMKVPFRLPAALIGR